MKQCTKCKQTKPYDQFSVQTSKKNGLRSNCKECEAIYRHKYYLKNKEKERQILKEWRKNNREKFNRQSRIYYWENKEKENNKSKRYYQGHKEEIIRRTVANIKAKMKIDPKMRLNHNLSSGLRQSLKKGKEGHGWEKIVGYTLNDLITRIESNFKSGMTWENYGRYGWHIDHIIPICRFKYTKVSDSGFKKCWSLSNLQPLWAIENLSKPN